MKDEAFEDSFNFVVHIGLHILVRVLVSSNFELRTSAALTLATILRTPEWGGKEGIKEKEEEEFGLFLDELGVYHLDEIGYEVKSENDVEIKEMNINMIIQQNVCLMIEMIDKILRTSRLLWNNALLTYSQLNNNSSKINNEEYIE